LTLRLWMTAASGLASSFSIVASAPPPSVI
jgi:hypothetical protein